MDIKVVNIKKHLDQFGYKYINIDNDESINNIHNLFLHNILFKPKYEIDYLYLGVYFYILKDYETMKTYYLTAIEKGNAIASYNLGQYYYKHEQNYKLMKKYHLLAYDRGLVSGLNNLGYYYQNNKHKYDKMKKYYLIAINNNILESMYNYGIYFNCVAKNYKMMRMYYLMSIKDKYVKGLYNLSEYYIANNSRISILELYLNYSNLITIETITLYVNTINIQHLSSKDKIKFYQLLQEHNNII